MYPQILLNLILKGGKDGMYFITDNSENTGTERRGNGTNSGFWDDCSAWKNARTPMILFLHRVGRLKIVVLQKINQKSVLLGDTNQ